MRPPPSTPSARLICQALHAAGVTSLAALAGALMASGYAPGSTIAAVHVALSRGALGRGPMPEALGQALFALVGSTPAPEPLLWPVRRHRGEPTGRPVKRALSGDGLLVARAQRAGGYRTRAALAAAIGIDSTQLSRARKRAPLPPYARARLEILRDGGRAEEGWQRAASKG